jgi:hypothetical protein
MATNPSRRSLSERKRHQSKRLGLALARKYSKNGTQPKNKKADQGDYTSIKTGQIEMYGSSYELRRFKALDASPLVKKWTKKHRVMIPYVAEFRSHWYVPDILVTMEDGTVWLEEVKGYIHSQLIFEAKNKAAEAMCERRGWKYRILFEKDIDTVL